MATQLPSLFGATMDPEQMAEARALQFAQMSPQQQMQYNIYRNVNRLGRGVAGLLGADVEDPTMKKASQLRQLASQFDTTTAEGMMQYAQALRNIDPNLAVQAAQQAQAMMKSQSEVAKNIAAASRERQQAIPADIVKAQQIAGLKQGIRSLEGQEQTPDVVAALQTYKDQLDALEPKEKLTKPVVSELGKLIAERNALDPVKDKESYDAYNAKIKKLTTGKSIGEELAAGLSPLVGAIAKGQAQKAGEAAGTDVGKQSAAVQGKYTALTSIRDALDVVDRGIYAGGYGPLEEAIAKYGAGVVGNKNRLVNTEEFRAYIGDVVIPRLQEFGGNDSVEELKYLRSVMAGETTLEATSIKRILKNADTKIRAGIKRLEAQQKAITEGKPVPVGPMTDTQGWSIKKVEKP